MRVNCIFPAFGIKSRLQKQVTVGCRSQEDYFFNSWKFELTGLQEQIEEKILVKGIFLKLRRFCTGLIL